LLIAVATEQGDPLVVQFAQASVPDGDTYFVAAFANPGRNRNTSTISLIVQHPSVRGP
jgi:hypothetical protein